jgi:hypothetical protein
MGFYLELVGRRFFRPAEPSQQDIDQSKNDCGSRKHDRWAIDALQHFIRTKRHTQVGLQQSLNQDEANDQRDVHCRKRCR